VAGELGGLGWLRGDRHHVLTLETRLPCGGDCCRFYSGGSVKIMLNFLQSTGLQCVEFILLTRGNRGEASAHGTQLMGHELRPTGHGLLIHVHANIQGVEWGCSMSKGKREPIDYGLTGWPSICLRCVSRIWNPGSTMPPCPWPSISYR